VEPNLTAVAPGSELESRERVDRHRVGLDPAHVAKRDAGAARLQRRADTRAEPGQVVAGDRAADGERDRLRRWGSHREKDRPDGQESSVRRPIGLPSRAIAAVA
jgi:hypothetical protein